MLPGKKYTPEDVLKILRKRIWFVVVPWAAIAAATAVAARKLPDRYSSSAVIQVARPQVPDSIVRPMNSRAGTPVWRSDAGFASTQRSVNFPSTDSRR